MRKQTKKIAFAVLFSMAMSFVAPSQISAFAAKTFEYAEEVTGESIKELALEIGEQVNLKPIGANSSTTWKSSNTRVAVVDSMGVITALSKGTATITMTLNGYTSEGVKVSVGDDREVSIGVNEELFGYTMEQGTSVEFMYFGLLDGTESRYECNWTSTNPSVATVDSATGKVTAKKEGFTVLCLTLTNKNTKTEYVARPIAIEVVEDGVVEPTTKPVKPMATATPKPTATTTPKATATPIPTATPTQAPAGEQVAYMASLIADNCILLNFFNTKVDDTLDVRLWKISEFQGQEMKVSVLIETKLSSDGKQINVYPGDATTFENGQEYLVEVNGENNAQRINVNIGAPNDVKVSYECIGEEGKAYVYDEAIGLEVPVTLSYQLYYNNVNVTETYKDNGYIEYEFLNPKDADNININLSDNILNFYSKTYTTLQATYYYEDANGDYKECKNRKPITITAQTLPAYKIDGLVEWTIIDTEKSEKIDWDKPVKYTVSKAENQKVVALIKDNYGRYYATDERGVDETKGIYFIEDSQQLFFAMGYGVEFDIKLGENEFLIDSNGDLVTYQTTDKGKALLRIFNDNTGVKKEYQMYPLQVKGARKLNSIQVDNTGVSLATTSIAGYEDKFSKAKVEILLKDQYGNDWDGDYDLTLTSNVQDITNALTGSASAPAYLDGTTLHINAENIMDITTRTSVSFTVTETTTNRTAKVTVTLKKPKISDANEIVVNAYQMGLKENEITLIDKKADTEVRSAQLEIYQLSNTVKVGLYGASQIVIQEDANHKFNVDSCVEGQVYVLVLGPDGKPVKEAESADSVGVWVDAAEDCVKINVAGKDTENSSVIEFLKAGRYTIKATRITKVDKTVQKSAITPNSLYFTVEDNTSDVEFKSLKGRETTIKVTDKTDKESVKQIIVELFRFRLDNKEWSTLTTDMITDVTFSVSKEYVVVHDIEFAVPYEGDSYMSYKKVIKDLDQAIGFLK